MPERVVNIASEISELAAEKLRQIQRVADTTKTLALNARIARCSSTPTAASSPPQIAAGCSPSGSR